MFSSLSEEIKVVYFGIDLIVKVFWLGIFLVLFYLVSELIIGNIFDVGFEK